jgi:hypothetical protein
MTQTRPPSGVVASESPFVMGSRRWVRFSCELEMVLVIDRFSPDTSTRLFDVANGSQQVVSPRRVALAEEARATI